MSASGLRREIVVKKSQRGKAFCGARNIPNCDAVYWNKPVLEPCPNCDAPFLLEKTTKKQGTFRYCANEECGYGSNDSAPALPSPAAPKAKRPAAR